MAREAIIIVAGGQGNRMGSELPKQFIDIAGKPILVHTIEKFLSYNPEIQIILVLPEEHVSTWESLAEKYFQEQSINPVIGGKTRYNSVQNGMRTLNDCDVVGVHDGVRPLVSVETIKTCYQQAATHGSAIPSMPVEETLRQLNGESSEWVNRDHYRSIQTPQCFRFDLLQNAYDQGYSDSFTDDASVVEALGHKINLVEGNRENIKITRPADLKLAEIIIRSNHA